MIKTKVRAYIIFILAFVLIGAGILVLDNMVRENSSKIVSIDEEIGKEDYSNRDIYLEMAVSKSWLEDNTSIGAQYDGIIHNTTNHIINNWVIDITVPDNSYIDSSWNGVYVQNGNQIHITPVDYNTTIEKESIDTFGYVMYTPTKFLVEKISFRGNLVYTREDFLLYKVLLAALAVTIISMILYFILVIREHSYKIKREGYRQIIIQSLNTFANIIDTKDPYTKGHSTRVAIYTREIAKRMGLDEDEQDNISYIALLHDVGKIGVPNEVLYKPCILTHEEMQVIQTHTTIGSEILKDFNALPGIKDGARSHHEKYDGTGYPDGLKRKNIPLYARIICVADSYDAMSSDRCYRPSLSNEEILIELERCSGSQFDPEIVTHMIAMIKDGFVRHIHEKEAQNGSSNSYPFTRKEIASIINYQKATLLDSGKEEIISD